jgi:hypothetical protein
MAGYVYVMVNASIQGKVKIGMTMRDPNERVKELSSATGIASTFILVFYEEFHHPAKAEKKIHELLEVQGFRENLNREFFEISTKMAIDTILQVKSEDLDNGNEDNVFLDEPTLEITEELAQSIFDKGEDALNAEVRGFIDVNEAESCLNSLEKLGQWVYYFDLGESLLKHKFGHYNEQKERTINAHEAHYIAAIKAGLNEYRWRLAKMYGFLDESRYPQAISLFSSFLQEQLKSNKFNSVYDIESYLLGDSLMACGSYQIKHNGFFKLETEVWDLIKSNHSKIASCIREVLFEKIEYSCVDYSSLDENCNTAFKADVIEAFFEEGDNKLYNYVAYLFFESKLNDTAIFTMLDSEESQVIDFAEKQIAICDAERFRMS